MTPAVIALRYRGPGGGAKPICAAVMRRFPPVHTLGRNRAGSYKIGAASVLSAFAPLSFR